MRKVSRPSQTQSRELPPRHFLATPLTHHKPNRLDLNPDLDFLSVNTTRPNDVTYHHNTTPLSK
jgi:hypothetical protein